MDRQNRGELTRLRVVEACVQPSLGNGDDWRRTGRCLRCSVGLLLAQNRDTAAMCYFGCKGSPVRGGRIISGSIPLARPSESTNCDLTGQSVQMERSASMSLSLPSVQDCFSDWHITSRKPPTKVEWWTA